ncbi:hypothetical protein [Amycolatopsis magusensis]|uniref:ABC-2 type transport system permease protein n=1 Tax=Amycolatopsis magusensis TaxID=882444 RepID=A0ABS4PR38_9PSEU|nr:hypothetical protein [Amycolatopsis magusensis]MBP2181879.1 ABC-2 type transport system permease protein [Amycolatopsis magusensis]
MVGVFVRLKLLVLRNSLRGSRIVGWVFGGLIGLLAAVGTLLVGFVPFDRPETSVDLLASIHAVWLIGWVLAPVATGGGDETLRPEHFALLPLSNRRLATGLLAASLVGVTTLVSLVAFSGLYFYGLRFGPAPALVGLLFAVLQLLLVVLVYRVVMAALGALLSSRKGKELGILLVALTGLSGIGLNYALNSVGPAIIQGQAPELVAVTRVLPSGWGAVAVHAAGTGSWGLVVVLLAGLVVLLGVLLTIWGALLARSVTSPSFHGAARVRSSAGQSSPVTVSPVGAVVRKELRTWWRDARRRVALMGTLIMGVVVCVVPSFSGDSTAPLALLGVFVAVFGCLQAGNLYGFDGSALWHTLVTPGAPRADVRGRQFAWVLLVAPLALVLGLVTPGVSGRLDLYPWVLGALPALLGAGAGVVLLQSVYVAYPLPDPRRNTSPWSSGGRPGCARVLMMFAITLLQLAAALPVIGVVLLGELNDSAVLKWAGVPVGLAVGGLLAWWWGALALRRLTDRGPELLNTVAKEI